MVNLTDEFNKNIPDSLGTAGQVLTVNSGATAGEWADAAGGSWNLLSTVNASSSSTVEFTSAITGYDAYAVIISNAINAGDGVRLRMRLKRSQDSGFNTSAKYSYGNANGDPYNSFAPASGSATNQSFIDLSGYHVASLNSDNAGHSYTLYFTNLNSSTPSKNIYGTGTYAESSAIYAISVLHGSTFRDTDTIDGIQFYFSSGNISTGKFSLYGLSV